MKKDLKTTDVSKLLQVQLIDEIIVRMEDKKLSEESVKKAKPFIVEFAKRNNISENAAMLFAAFFNDFADHQIWIRDIAGFFECNKVKILTMWSAIDELVSRRFILQYKKGRGDLYFTVPNKVVAAMREDRIYSPNANADLTIDKWLSALSRLLNDKDNDNIPYANFVEDLHVLINSNKHLVIARELATIMDDEHLVIFAGIMDLYIRNNDNHIIRTDLEDLMDTRWDMRMQARLLEKGNHPLQKAGLVEQSDSNGQVEADA